MDLRYRSKIKEKRSEGPTDRRQIFTESQLASDDSIVSLSSSSFLLESGNRTVDSNSSSSSMIPLIPKRSDWRTDKINICLLLFLYLLQGVPLGMAASIPLIIQVYGASWSQQATFSFAFWPFSLKLLWAPIVDAVYLKRFGRRKTWLVSTQYLIGLVMIVLSYHINDILLVTKTATNNQPHIYFLTSVFFGLSFLAATQDICVDGWALSMLSRENVAWSSVCNSVGQTAGYFLGNVVFLAFESKDFANRFVRQPLNMKLQSTGLITLSGFLLFWGLIFVISTTLVAVLKHERYDSGESHFGLTETYKVLLKVLKLSSVRRMAVILLTVKIGFAATDAMTGLELIERGVAKESLALLAIPLIPLQIILPFLISKYATGSMPLNVYVKSYPFRLILGLFMIMFVHFTPSFQTNNQTFPWYYYALAVLIYSIHQIFVYGMFVSQMAFFAQVSDPKIGGTYMTLLNTLSNLGGNWMSTGVLYTADYLTWKKCSLNNSRCETMFEDKNCHRLGGVCQIYIDPYYIETSICTVAGIIWLLWKYHTIMRLQNLPISAWQIPNNHRKKRLTVDADDDDSLSDTTA